jgi:trans-aconitate methyltransferase
MVANMVGQSDQRSKERGGVRRYLDTVTPEEYVPQTGEVDLTEISLTGLADLYGSDKGTIKHNYTHIYEQILRELNVTHRKTHSLRLAEIGVACGASLRMWANHLPAATIEGFDIQPECANLCRDLKNVTITISDPRQVNREGFDLVVDDGSHIAEDVLGNFVHCWKWVKPGGFYVIEDMACTYNDAYRDKYNKHFSKSLKNDRELMKTLWDAIAREIDAGVGAYTEMRYYRQMWVFKR